MNASFDLFLIRVWVWISWSGSSHGYTLTEISEKVWLQTKRNPVISPHWCECWTVYYSFLWSYQWFDLLLSGFWTHCSLFFSCPSWVSFIWLFSSSCSVPWLLLCFCFCSVLCVYMSWVLPESLSVHTVVYTVFEEHLLTCCPSRNTQPVTTSDTAKLQQLFFLEKNKYNIRGRGESFFEKWQQFITFFNDLQILDVDWVEIYVYPLFYHYVFLFFIMLCVCMYMCICMFFLCVLIGDCWWVGWYKM